MVGANDIHRTSPNREVSTERTRIGHRRSNTADCRATGRIARIFTERVRHHALERSKRGRRIANLVVLAQRVAVDVRQVRRLRERAKPVRVRVGLGVEDRRVLAAQGQRAPAATKSDKTLTTEQSSTLAKSAGVAVVAALQREDGAVATPKVFRTT